MSEILTLTDSTWKQAIATYPALVLFTNGEGVRGEFLTAFRKAAKERSGIIFAEINSIQNPVTAAEFEIGDKPVMLGLYHDQVLARRVRPWGADVPLALDLLEKAFMEDPNKQTEEPVNELSSDTPDEALVTRAPVHVTDDSFQQDVIDFSHNLPVLVDFWAEWCGPCRQVAPIMDKLAEEYAGKVRIAKVDTDANPGLSQGFRIMSIPTIMAFKEGKLVFNQPGAFPEAAFRDLLEQLIALEIPA